MKFDDLAVRIAVYFRKEAATCFELVRKQRGISGPLVNKRLDRRNMANTAATEPGPAPNALDRFRSIIASSLSGVVGVDVETLTKCIEAPKEATNGDFAIAVPRLRKPGNPVQMASTFAEKV